MFKSRRALKLAPLFAFVVFSQIFPLFADSNIIFRNFSVLQKESVDISQRWDYYKSDLIDPEAFYPETKISPASNVNLPHKMESGVNLATYHIRLSGLPPHERYSSDFYGTPLTASRVWCNGKIVATGGFLSKNRALCKPGDIFAPVDFQADKNGVIDIVVHLANFEKCEGGLAKSVKITQTETLRKRLNINYLLNSLIFAFLIAVIIYNIILASLNFKQFSYVTIVMLCSVYCCAICFTGYSLFWQRGLSLPFWLHRKLPVLALAVASALELLYIMPANKCSEKKTAVTVSLSFANAVILFFCPLDVYERVKWIFIYTALFFSLVRLIVPLKFALKRNFDAKKYFKRTAWAYNIGSFFAVAIFLFRVTDFLLVPQQFTIIHSYNLFKLSFLIFGISQCGIYAFNRDYSFIRVARQMDKFARTNNTLAKIVPPQVLKLLGANDITKIIPGESRIIDAVLFYAEIKHFNQLAESINKEELYSIQTDFFQAASPIIIDCGGFVAKYSISGCLAIFLQRNSDAINCAARLQRKMKEIRRKLRKTQRTDIGVGIAIHSGKVAVGTIGSNVRLDCMALSEDVNITYAVGKQTSKTNTQILITEDAMPFCRSYINYVYEGHYFISNGKQILVYSALPIKKNEQAYEDTLEPIEDENEL
ncbi:MAG: hypothetical protein J6V90_09865 [Treponema sp.]|nr:hypothetical protein [Treponema sp.]